MKKKTRLRVTPERCPVYKVVCVTSQSHACRWKAQAMIQPTGGCEKETA